RAVGGVQPVRPQGLVEPVGRAPRIPEQQHGFDAPAEEAACDLAEEAAPQAPAVVRAEQVDLVELAGKVRLVGVRVPLPLGKADELAVGVFDDETEPAAVGRLERLSPLILAEFEGWPVPEYRRVRLVKSRHVKAGQGGNVGRSRLPDDNGLHVVPYPTPAKPNANA